MDRYFDRETGEVYDLEALRRHEKKRGSLVYMTPFVIGEIDSEQDLRDRSSATYPRGTGVLGCVDWERVLVEGGFDNKELRVLGLLCQQLTHHNYGCVDRCGADISRATWHRALAALVDKNIVKCYGLVEGGLMLYALHPFYGWVGHHKLREGGLSRWN